MTARGARKKKDPQKKHAGKGGKKGARKGAKKSKWKRILFSPRSKRALLAAAVVTAVAALGVAAWFAEEYASGPGSAPYRPIIERWARRYGVSPDMVAAVLECESSGRVRAVSESGALGLMQLMPKTAGAMAKELGLKEPSGRDLFDPGLNIRLGSYYLSKLWKRFGGERMLVVAAYHAGPTNIDEWRKQRKYASTEAFIAEVNAPATRAYVRKVMRRWERLAGEKAGE